MAPLPQWGRRLVYLEGTTVVIFNRRDLALVLDDPQADLGRFEVGAVGAGRLGPEGA